MQYSHVVCAQIATADLSRFDVQWARRLPCMPSKYFIIVRHACVLQALTLTLAKPHLAPFLACHHVRSLRYL